MGIPDSSRWEEVRPLGQGGQGSVSVVRDKTGEFTQQFALKTLLGGRSPEAYVRFAREIDALKKLSNPGIVKVIDHSEPGEAFQFYVMEFVEGARSLQEVLKSGANPFLENSRLCIGLAEMIVDALAACQALAERIVHRDLSPKNILLLPDGTIKLIDFGCCSSGAGSTVTLVDEGFGTRNYTPPECESGGTGEVGFWSDAYSLGKIVWAMATGREAFAREAPVFSGGLSMQSMFELKLDLWHLQPLFEKTIRRDPENRWRSPDQARLELTTLRYRLEHGYIPVEMAHRLCPVCGFGQIRDLKIEPNVFRQMFENAVARTCSSCGHVWLYNPKVWEQRDTERKKYE